MENYKEPLKEILHSDIIYNDNAQDVFFMEITVKTHSNFVTNVNEPFLPIDLKSEELGNLTISLRAFSLTRNLWIKDY